MSERRSSPDSVLDGLRDRVREYGRRLHRRWARVSGAVAGRDSPESDASDRAFGRGRTRLRARADQARRLFVRAGQDCRRVAGWTARRCLRALSHVGGAAGSYLAAKRETYRERRGVDPVVRRRRGVADGRYPYGTVTYTVAGRSDPERIYGYVAMPEGADTIRTATVYPPSERIVEIPIDNVEQVVYEPAPPNDGPTPDQGDDSIAARGTPAGGPTRLDGGDRAVGEHPGSDAPTHDSRSGGEGRSRP
jgi:hypothetical protein